MRVPSFPTRTARLIAAAMFGVGVAAATLPLKAEAQAMLCEFQLSSCGDGSVCQGLCTTYYFGSTGICNSVNGCCNCYF